MNNFTLYLSKCCHALVWLLTIFVLFSCGGNSSVKEASPTTAESIQPTTNLPSVDAGVDNTAYELETVTIQATASASESASIISYSWHQVSGITTTLSQNNTSNLNITIPEVSGSEELNFQLTVTDSNDNQASDSVKIKVTSFPVQADAGSDKNINEETVVELDGSATKTNALATSFNWQQLSGTAVKIIKPNNAVASFTAPQVTSEQTLIFQLTTTRNDYSSTDTVTINIIDIPNTVPKHVLLFTNERITTIKNRIAQNSEAWDYLSAKLTNYYDKTPYNAGEYAAAFALAFYISDEQKYMDRAIKLLQQTYFSKPDIGWDYYNSRNLFRTNGRWAMLGYSWIKGYISIDEQEKIENIFKVWGEFWLTHIDYDNDYEKLKKYGVKDTDDTTSLSENLTLLGYILSESTSHQSFGSTLLNAGDTLLNDYVVNYYMKDIMAGGAWAEGSDYSPNTQRHWIRIFMINKDQRNIEYPIDYAHETMQALIHQTLSNYTSLYKYGSEEAATDYEPIGNDYRNAFAYNLMGILTEEKDQAELYQWFNVLLAKEGFKKGSMVTGFQRLMYHDPSFTSNLSTTPGSTMKYASGIGLVSARSHWNKDASNLFFINRGLRVDHEHQDALSFDLAYKGQWITKESTGYAGVATTSVAHNTMLIENASNGSSSPTLRPAGEPKYHYIFDDNIVTLISADASNVYNMSGYYATNYAQQVTRQLAFIKPNLLISYDHIKTDKNQIKDLLAYNKELALKTGDQHTRWVKVIQHVQNKPIYLSPLKYSVNTTESELLYQVIYPSDATINVIDEKLLWREANSYNLPDNQKKWHFEITNKNSKEDNEFISMLSFDAKSTKESSLSVSTPEYILMTKENTYIEQGNIIGLAIKRNPQNIIILFNQQPKNPIGDNDYKINIPQDYESATIYKVAFSTLIPE